MADEPVARILISDAAEVKRENIVAIFENLKGRPATPAEAAEVQRAAAAAEHLKP